MAGRAALHVLPIGGKPCGASISDAAKNQSEIIGKQEDDIDWADGEPSPHNQIAQMIPSLEDMLLVSREMHNCARGLLCV